MKNEVLVNSIILKMFEIVQKFNLEIMARYPKDINVHDRNYLMNSIAEGAQFAWIVGNSHSHLTVLGVSPESNDMVNCFANLGNDKYYSITIKKGEAVFKQYKSSDEFRLLAKTPLNYNIIGKNDSFWLMSGQKQIGLIEVEITGDWTNRLFTGYVTPMSNVSQLDKTALSCWAYQAIVKTAGTLFVNADVVWNEPYPENKAA